MKKEKVSLLKITLCGPGDVLPEIDIAQRKINDWNLQHGEARGFFLKHQHWSKDAHPDLKARPQGVINQQIIKDSDIIVAIFWSRFGSPTGQAESGTEEEIREGVRLGKKVMVYFSNLEPLPVNARQGQVDRLWLFRQELRKKGLCESFSSRSEFREKFATQLSLSVNELKKPKQRAKKVRLQQEIRGDNNIQVGGNFQVDGDFKVYTKAPKINNIIERPDGAVSPGDLLRIQGWIEKLAEGEINISRQAAYAKWGARIKKRFQISKREELLTIQMEDVEAWYKQMRGMQTEGLRAKAPEQWRDRRIAAIKAAMRKMGVTNDEYYPEVAKRLKMKRGFTSLKDLTKNDLDRVCSMARRDSL